MSSEHKRMLDNSLKKCIKIIATKRRVEKVLSENMLNGVNGETFSSLAQN